MRWEEIVELRDKVAKSEAVVEAARKLYDCYPQWPDTDNLGEWSALGVAISALPQDQEAKP